MTTVSLPRPAERTAILSFVLVFICGALLGAVVMSLVRPRLHDRPAAAVSLNGSVSEWKTQLNLSEEQVRQLTSILDDFGHYYDNLLADGNSRVLQVLTPEQRTRYEKLKREHRVR
jgi:hypothetical protein